MMVRVGLRSTAAFMVPGVEGAGGMRASLLLTVVLLFYGDFEPGGRGLSEADFPPPKISQFPLTAPREGARPRRSARSWHLAEHGARSGPSLARASPARSWVRALAPLAGAGALQLASALGRSSASPGPGSQRLPCPLGGTAGAGRRGRGLAPAANQRPPPKSERKGGRAGPGSFPGCSARRARASAHRW